MTLNTAETQGKDPILGNKDTHIQEAILDPDILNHQQTIDINPNIEIMKTKKPYKNSYKNKNNSRSRSNSYSKSVIRSWSNSTNRKRPDSINRNRSPSLNKQNTTHFENSISRYRETLYMKNNQIKWNLTLLSNALTYYVWSNTLLTNNLIRQKKKVTQAQ